MSAPVSIADGRYRLADVLGAGGMATVYRAYDERLQVYRAVKLLSRNLQEHPVVRERFQTEARTMARLHHPNIVSVHDIGIDGIDTSGPSSGPPHSACPSHGREMLRCPRPQSQSRF